MFFVRKYKNILKRPTKSFVEGKIDG